MKLSLNIGNRQFGFSVGKSMNASPSDFITGKDVDEGALLVSAFEQSTWIYSCIGAIGKQIAQIPLRISRGSRAPVRSRSAKWRRKAIGEDLVETGPLIELLNRPHPQLTRFDFWNLALAWLMLRGDTFAVPATDADECVDLSIRGAGRNVKRLIVISPDQVREWISGNALQVWHFYGGTRSPLPTMDLLPTEVIYSKLANPFDFWRGMAPLAVAQLAAQTDFAAAQMMKGLMRNNASLGDVLRTEQQPDETQRRQMIAAWQESRRKAGTANRPTLLWGGMEIVKPDLTSVDMQFLENRKFNRQEICAIFGVPQEVLGFTEDANRSVGDAARLNFIENTISPLCELFEAALDPLVRSFDPNFSAWFDVDALPIMQRARQTRFATAQTAMTGMGVPLNDVNGLFDLGLPDDLPHGEIVFLPFNLTEFGATPPAPEETPAESETSSLLSRAMQCLGLKSNPGSTESRSTHVCAAPQGFEEVIAPSIRLKKNKLSKFFFEQRVRVLTSLEKEVKKDAKARSLDDIWNSKNEDGELLKKLKPLLLGDLEFGGAQVWQEIAQPDKFLLAPNDAIEFLNNRANVIKDINATTWNALRTSLQEGLSAGESYDQMAERVKGIYNTAGSSRAAMIALTETNVAVNSGRQLAMEQAGVERKGWLTSHLENTRATHTANEIHSETYNGIEIDDIWPNGCAYPGDPDGEAGETINCRCVGYAIKGEKSFKPVKFLNFAEFCMRCNKEAKP